MGSGTAIVITDATVLKDLMDKRSQSTVDRPSMYVANRITEGKNMIMGQYSRICSLRPLFHELISLQPKIGALRDVSRTKP